MSKNEKNYILTNYTSNRQAKLQLFCSKSKGVNIFDKFCYSTAFNRPDMYFVNNKICYMFEHFEVDASLYIGGVYEDTRTMTKETNGKKEIVNLERYWIDLTK